MILTLLFWILNGIAWLYDLIVPGFLIPEAYFEPINQGIEAAMKFNGLIPIETAISAIRYILLFELCLLVAKIVIGIANYMRGTGSIELD